VKILTPVTAKLARTLAETGNFLVLARQKEDRLNDEADLKPLTKALETLAVTLLNVGGATDTLIGTAPTGARFDTGSGSDVYESLSNVVEYLRNDVPGQLNGPLDRYRALYARRALGYLEDLHKNAVDGITRQAARDLDKVSEKHIGWLLIAAGQLAEAAESARISPPATPWVKDPSADQPA
jgi:hypothetical protein